MVVQERRGNLKSRSRVNFKLSEKRRPSIKKVSEKCQKSLSGGNGSALRAVRTLNTSLVALPPQLLTLLKDLSLLAALLALVEVFCIQLLNVLVFLQVCCIFYNQDLPGSP